MISVSEHTGALLALLRGLVFIAVITLGARAAASGAPAPDAGLPQAIYTDPPVDPAHPASATAIQFASDGALVNGILYRPAGEGAHPTVVLLHGLPGYDQNLDLGQSMRRAGWAVVSFHYRGTWGSGGRYAFGNGIGDTEALLALLRRPGTAKSWGVDAKRLVLIGHSYGGFVAARVAFDEPGLLGVALLAPWDISFDRRSWMPLTEAHRRSVGLAAFDDVDGRLTGANALTLTDEVMREGSRFDLTALAPRLAGRPLLIITATRDDDDDKAKGLLAALNDARGQELTAEVMDTDHAFSDHRIALQAAILRWLASLPGAPPLATAR